MYAIGTLPLPYEYDWTVVSAPPLELTSDYVQLNYVIIGDRNFGLVHNDTGGWYPSNKVDYDPLDFNWQDINRVWITGDIPQAIPNERYAFNCQNVVFTCGTKYTYFINSSAQQLIPLTGVEIFFTSNPNTPLGSPYAYSGVMELGEIYHDFSVRGTASVEQEHVTSCSFSGIADMDLPSTLLLDNFDTYIPKIRYGIYTKGNILKIVINGVVVRTGKVKKDVVESVGWDVSNFRYWNNDIGIDARSRRILPVDYPNILVGKHPFLLSGYIINADNSAEGIRLQSEISTYNCKYVNLRQGLRYQDYDNRMTIGGLVTTNYRNSMPSFVVS